MFGTWSFLNRRTAKGGGRLAGESRDHVRRHVLGFLQNGDVCNVDANFDLYEPLVSDVICLECVFV